MLALPKFCPIVLSLAFLPAAHAEKHHPENPTSVLLARAEAAVLPMRTGEVATDVKAQSAGVAVLLPDLPRLAVAISTFRARLAQKVSARPGAPRESFNKTLPDGPGVSLIDGSPLAAAAHRIGAQHFNTEDGSSADAFAICYRVSRRSSIQVVPGDPAPVKIPVTSMANNMGVTIGMVLRLTR